MKKIYIANGFNSWSNKEITKAFSNEDDARNFLEGLTDPKILLIPYKTSADLVNHLLKS